MFRLDADKSVEFCDGLRRRDFLHAGALSFLGLGLPQVFGLKALGAVDESKKDMNCIMLMLIGGPSQLDTWDMKPNAPVEIRGPYKPIKTNVSGIEISENFPRMAKHADKYALIRSVYHTAAAVHDTGHQMMQTGRLFQGGIEYPHIGCVLAKLKGPKGDVPPHVLMPRPIGNTGGNMPHGQTAGFLGKTFDPFVLNADPSDPNFKVPDLLPPDYLSALRVDRRRNWREMIDHTVSKFETSQDARLLDATFHQAYTLMSSQKAREAFELSKEPESVRQKYGLNRFGQSCLLARRLIEAGVRFVTVNMFETVFDEITWDIHGSKPFSPISCYRDLVGPMYDNAFSSLLEDLQDRRLLDTTMITAMGEFGRTPKINKDAGRDHWPKVSCALLACGGLRTGQVIGSTDRLAGEAKDRPVHFQEVFATLYHSLGLDVSKVTVRDLSGRPQFLVDEGRTPMKELV
jgi:hypothetical protein